MAAKILIILTDSESLCLRLIQFSTAIFTIFRPLFMSGLMAMRTLQPAPFTLFTNHCGRHNPRRNSDNRITDQHHDSREKTSDRCHRRYISVADSRHRHNRPIDAVRYIIELRTGLVSFYHIHYRTDRSHQNQDKKEKHKYLRCADP